MVEDFEDIDGFNKIRGYCIHCGKQIEWEPYIPPTLDEEEKGFMFCSFQCYDEYLIDGKISLPKIELPWKDDEELREL